MARRIEIVAAWLMLGVFQTVMPPAAARAEDSVASKQPATAEEIPADRLSAEQRVNAFLEAHQPELAKVLAHLKKRKPEEHAKAVDDLADAVKKLDRTKAKDEQLHELELKAWQARTRVDLLVARWMAARKKDRADLEVKLREAVDAELDVRAEQLAYRRQRSAAWYDRQIERLREKRAELVAARMKSLLDDEDAEKPKAPAGEQR